MRHRVADRLHCSQQAQRLELGHHRLARREAIEPAIGDGGVVVDAREGVEHVDHRQLVALADLEVVEIVSRGDLHRPRALFRIRIVVGDDRDRPPDDRQPHAAPDQRLVALVGGMHGDGRVAEHGFGTGGGDHDLAGAILQRIGEMPVVPVDLALFDFQIGDGGLELWVPVDQPLVAIDQLLPIQGDEHLAHRGRQPFVQGEALATPVARRPQPTKLPDDLAAGRRLPRPDPLDKGFTTQVAAADVAGGGELPLNDHLRGDTGMVGAGQPQGGVAAHPGEPGQHVLQGVVEGVADVQRAGDVGRRNDHAERSRRRVVDGREDTGSFPGRVEARLRRAGIEGLI